jgi:hypothetical protein
MLEDTPTHGSMLSTSAFKKKCAVESLEFNCKNKYGFERCAGICSRLTVYHDRTFCDLFPELVELNNARQAARKANPPPETSGSTTTDSCTPDSAHNDQLLSWPALLAILAAILACFWALFSYIV